MVNIPLRSITVIGLIVSTFFVISLGGSTLEDDKDSTLAMSYGEMFHYIVRKLIGSNCILIERGDVPPYYDCMGCVIEEAQGCLDDMRYNRSGNVYGTCTLASHSQSYDTSCCPRFDFDDLQNRFDLSYVGSAYPEALRCIANVGCPSSTIYEQLLGECEEICSDSDPRDDGNVCFSDFNAGTSAKVSMGLTALCAILISLLLAT